MQCQWYSPFQMLRRLPIGWWRKPIAEEVLTISLVWLSISIMMLECWSIWLFWRAAEIWQLNAGAMNQFWKLSHLETRKSFLFQKILAFSFFGGLQSLLCWHSATRSMMVKRSMDFCCANFKIASMWFPFILTSNTCKVTSDLLLSFFLGWC